MEVQTFNNRSDPYLAVLADEEVVVERAQALEPEVPEVKRAIYPPS